MGTLAEEYYALAQRDIRTAFSRVWEDTKKEQEKLRGINPSNPFLGLVSLVSGGLNFSKNFRTLIFEHTTCEPKDHLYFALGLYVELLQQEQVSPRFPPKSRNPAQ